MDHNGRPPWVSSFRFSLSVKAGLATFAAGVSGHIVPSGVSRARASQADAGTRMVEGGGGVRWKVGEERGVNSKQ